MPDMKKCGNGHYTFRDECPRCGSVTRTPKPPKFSPHDKYGKYRRMAKANK